MEYILEGTCLITAKEGGITLDVEDPAYDLSHVSVAILETMALQVIEPTKDISQKPYSVIHGLAVSFWPRADIYFNASAIIDGLRCQVSAKKAKWFDIPNVFDSTLGVIFDPEADRSSTGSSNLGVCVDLRPTSDRLAILSEINDPGFSFDVEALMRSILTIPPKGVLYIMGSAIDDEGELPLDGAEVPRGQTTIIGLDVLGTRLDMYKVEFRASLVSDESAPSVIYKDNTNRPGGIYVKATHPIATDSEANQQLLAQIVLEPRDTLQFSESRRVFWECWMGCRGISEQYRIARGTFTITVD